MDDVFRMTPLAVSALALLEERAMHPYEMLQLLRERHKATIFTIKAGSLYHTMARLAELGLAEVQGTERAGNRPERTLYALAPAGRQAYVAWVREHLDRPTTPQEFAVALAEAHNLHTDEVVAILSGRHAELSMQAKALRSELGQVRERGVPEAYYLVFVRMLALLDADVAWTAETLRRLDAGDIHWSYQDRPAGEAGDECTEGNLA
jgi:DNA-binding PadR family transcriptional regulator